MDNKHPLDKEYFESYNAPIMEHIHKLHDKNINSTIPFFGPMMYFLIRALRCQYVLEIGHSYGYTSWYMANAIQDNMTRFQYNQGMYVGIDIVKTSEVQSLLKGLPVQLLNLDSIRLTQDFLKGITFDLIFQDGAHDAVHVIHEMETLYPRLRGEGLGYWVMHDALGPGEEGYNVIKNDTRYNFERVCLDDQVYGMAIMRKMDGYKEHKHWQGEKH